MSPVLIQMCRHACLVRLVIVIDRMPQRLWAKPSDIAGAPACLEVPVWYPECGCFSPPIAPLDRLSAVHFRVRLSSPRRNDVVDRELSGAPVGRDLRRQLGQGVRHKRGDFYANSAGGPDGNCAIGRQPRAGASLPRLWEGARALSPEVQSTTSCCTTSATTSRRRCRGPRRAAGRG